MKRKRRDLCPSPLLDEIPKRTKVHAQRKFAQGSNVNSPVITPVKEFERTDRSNLDLIPEPVELLPIQRQNTEDFLTFLCFRGTPILPPNLNFFNTASIVDTNGQVHEIKSESPKNGPIDTSIIPKGASGPSDRPFIAFGVRKRADPIVISKQMERKRRHALALQALRRKYQEQKMAKIRAVTISKLSEKPSNRATARSNTLLKLEKTAQTVTTKTVTPKTKVKIISSKAVNPQTLRNLNTKIKPRMCLRSFRGRFVQQELPFRAVKKSKLPEKKVMKTAIKKKMEMKKNVKAPVKVIPKQNNPSRTVKEQNDIPKKPKISKIDKNEEARVTRSSNVPLKTKLSGKKVIKRRILVPSATLVKSRVLRSQTVNSGSSSQSRSTRRCLNRNIEKSPKKNEKKIQAALKSKSIKKTGEVNTQNAINDSKKNANTNKIASKPSKEDENKSSKTVKAISKVPRHDNDSSTSKNTSDESSESKKESNNTNQRKETNAEVKKDKKIMDKPKESESKAETKKINLPTILDTDENIDIKSGTKKISVPRKCVYDKVSTTKNIKTSTAESEPKYSQRPSRKTKEAAAIYMEILSHKLVHENKVDDDTVSIDSFPELPNVKRTEQRENELKAKANITKTDRTNKHEKFSTVEETVTSLDDGNRQQVESKEIILETQSKKKNLKQSLKKNKTLEIVEKITSEHSDKKLQLQEERNEKDEEKSIIKLEKEEMDTKKIKLEARIPNFKSDIKTEVPEDGENSKTVPDSMKEVSKTEDENQREKVMKCLDVLGQSATQPTKCDIDKMKQEKAVKGIKKTKTSDKHIVETKKLDASKSLSIDGKIFPSDNQIFEQKIYKKLYPKDSSDSDECLAKIPRISKTLQDCKNKLLCTKKNSESLKPLEKIGQTKPGKTESSDSDNECLAKIRKTRNVKKQTDRRETRRSCQQGKKLECDDSEDSFHVDVKIPRKKLLTRSKSSKISSTSKAKSNFDDHSDVSSKSSKEKSLKSIKGNTEPTKEANFSDSDEEPLSKLTLNKQCDKKSTEELKEDILRKQKALIESPPRSKGKKVLKHKEKEVTNKDRLEELPGKQKRECAKIPSNYLPMFSSSDDEEKFFHGFSPKNEKKKESIYSHSSLDFLSKDLGRRFGKEKVNMSNEQIEKWLKDSAMAGDASKKAEELKYCEEISIETSLNKLSENTTEQLKSSSLEPGSSIDSKEITPEKKNIACIENLKCPLYKSPDRKPIFKKEKSKVAPTVGAFSVNNESSIYAFEEEIEEAVSTPFRRPSRRPSSTATSKSEDELSKSEDQSRFGQFRKPVLKNEANKSEEQKSTENTLKQTQSNSQKLAQKSSMSRNVLGKSMKKNNPEHFDDFKYKVPSSPSASSSSSAKLYKRQNKSRSKPVENCNPVHMADFPCNGPGELVEAPTFYPSEKEFQDPLEYIEKIGSKAEQFGICKIVPPNTFKPECKVSDDMRFTSYNQYVHKMLHRWGPNFKELMAIKKYLQTQNINLKQPPWIGGMEVDLPRLYQTVQSLGGLKEVIEKEKWSKVSDIMRIPKSAQDRVTKLDDIYCKYLLPYDTLSPDERDKLLDEVETAWAKRESKTLSKMQKSDEVELENESDSESDNEVEECITKGRNMALNAFYRIARNTMSMWFKTAEPTVQDIEQEFWKHVVHRENHICVHSGSIDSGSYGYGFAVSKNSPFARHAWNLKVLTNNSGSLLRSLGPIMGVTVPTLHVGMVFSACCWYRDPHSLPWIEYLHTGGKKIWYGIPNSVGDIFQKALTKLVPNYCRNQGIWLPSDTVMLPPSLLIESGVSLSRVVQEPGEFIVVFPRAFTSSISTGYVVSESVFFAPPSWLRTAQTTFDLLKESCEPSMFSLERLYLSIINDQRTNVEVLKQMIPIVSSIHSKEKEKRGRLQSLGVNTVEVLPPPEAPNSKKKKKSQDAGDYECELCRTNLFISSVMEKQENANYCLDHAIEQIEKKSIQPDNCKLLYTYSENDLEDLISKINKTIEQKLQKKVFSKFSGMPTLLK
ncbi:protein Jumonji [Coccinella septempunctata]|uniref:protein Jumonji n=1 Tax=Coccinella septempunctata TaxID=41139 RepID=UPI001D098688|nr:protein Jumonji [Coccinella septempunctata]XP_044766851.1 protein Jumonji [Coccinella septempunctata]